MRILIAALALGLVAAAPAPAASDTRDDRWPELRQRLFGDRPIQEADEVIGIEAPYRASDAALVPITVQDLRPPGTEPALRRLHLIVDNNPEPLAGVFRFGPAAGRVALSTRIRINAYTHVRAVAETADGRLLMGKRFVKASGGCSAPVGAEEAEALQDLGRIRMRSWPAEGPGGERVQVMIRHPNYSGLQMDQLTRLYRPAHFVERLEVLRGSEPVLQADLTITLSRNPSLRFYVEPAPEKALRVRARDNEGNEFRRGGPGPSDPPG